MRTLESLWKMLFLTNPISESAQNTRGATGTTFARRLIIFVVSEEYSRKSEKCDVIAPHLLYSAIDDWREAGRHFDVTSHILQIRDFSLDTANIIADVSEVGVGCVVKKTKWFSK